MVAILQYLRSQGVVLPVLSQAGVIIWPALDPHQKIVDYYCDWIMKHQKRTGEYSAYCMQLGHNLLREDDVSLTEQIKAAFIIADIMEHVYVDYLDNPREAARFTRDKRFYQQLLAKRGYCFSVQEASKDQDAAFMSVMFRNFTGIGNLFRNLAVRSRRTLAALTILASDFERLCQWFLALDIFVQPILNYAAWIFFIPRLLTNIVLILKHTIPNPWMSNEEYELDWWLRLWVQIQRRWFDLANDLAWITLGLLNCFVFTGALLALNFYGTVFMLIYDVVLAGLRFHIEMGRLQDIEQHQVAMIAPQDTPQEIYEQTMDYLKQLQTLMAFEQKRLSVLVVQTCLLLLAFSLSFSLIAFHPCLPVIGGVIAVITTIACHMATQSIEQGRPLDNPAEIQKQGSVVPFSLFKPANKEEQGISPALNLQMSY